MRKNYLVYPAVASLVLFFSPHPAFSQNCDCPEFQKLQKEQRNNKEFDKNAALKKLRETAGGGCLAAYYEWIAEDFIKLRLLDSAEVWLEKAAAFYKKNSCKDAAYINYYKQTASIRHNQGNYTVSLEHSFKLLPLAEASGNKYEEANCLLMISQTFDRMKVSDKGIIYARKAAGMLRGFDSPNEKAELLYKTASRFLWYYQDTHKKEVLDSAEQFTLEQLELCRQSGNLFLLRKGYNHMNGYAHERGDYPKALRYVDSSLLSFNGKDNPDEKATDYGDKADILMEMGKFAEARKYADTCLLYHQLGKNPETIANAYALIYQVSNRSENYKDALWAMDQYLEINDSLTNVEKTKTISELEKKYNQAKNEKTIKELAQERRIYLLLAVAGFFGLVALAFFIRQQSLKSKQKILETEQRLNRARMNPHFFFNALTSLQKFALEENDGKALATNISKFSHIMRETLESTYKEYVTIAQETDFLREYLELQAIRTPQKFTFEINTAEEIDPDTLIIPSMILQPFVENSIEHGFAGIDYPGHVAISFGKEANDLNIRIIDNGKGMLATARENGEHISRASQIIKDRIYLLNIKLKTRASFSVDNNSNGKGVIVFIKLPLLYKQDIVK
ncbi:MAG: histidine kinase [Chitinophagaceae bacterium]